MKRITALFLSFVLLISCYPMIVFAENDYSIAQIDVVANGDEYQEDVIIRNDEIYMSEDAITQYSLYNNSCGNLLFFRRDQTDLLKTYKWVAYIKEEHILKIKNGSRETTVENVDHILHDGVYYLPVHKVLPYMDSVVSVSGGKLVIDSDNISMADAMYGFNDLDYMFNMAEEFADSEFLATLYYLIPYLFNTITDFRFDRASIRNINGNTNDYMKAYENIVLDNSEYINAISGDTSTNELLDVSDKLFDGAEAIDGIEKISEEVFDVTYKFGDDYFDLVEVCKELSKIKDGYKYAEFLYKYMNMVEDHSNMLGVVYGGKIKDNLDLFDVQEYRAAQLALAEYSKAAGMLFPVMSEGVKKLVDKAIDTTEVGVYKEAAKAMGDTLEVTLGLKYTEEVSLLPYYARIMYSAQDSLVDCRNNTKIEYDEEATRLSAIMFLIASQKCYKILAAQCQERLDSLICLTPELYKNNLKSYNAKINQISSRLALLYLAKNSAIVVDSDKLKKELENVAKRDETNASDTVPVVQQEAKSDWHWLVEPKIEADDIQPLRQFGCWDCSHEGGIVENGLSVYITNGKKGLISYVGLPVIEAENYDIFYSDVDGFICIEKQSGKPINQIVSARYEKKKVSENDVLYNEYDIFWHVWLNDKKKIGNGGYSIGSIDNSFTGTDGAMLLAKGAYEMYDDSSFLYDPYNSPKYVLISNGKRVGSAVYESFGVYSDGIIAMKKGGKWGYMTNDGKMILPFEFENTQESGIFDATSGYIVVKKNGEYAIYSTAGNMTIPYGTFDAIRPVYNGMFWAKKNGKWGVAELEGFANSFETVEPEECLDSEVEAVVNEKSGLRLRERASTDCNVLGMLSNKSKVYICGATGEWAYIRVDNVYGYVKMKYLLPQYKEIVCNDKEIIEKFLYNQKYKLTHQDYSFDKKPMDSLMILAFQYTIETYDYYVDENGVLISNYVDEIDQIIYHDYHISVNHDKRKEYYNDSFYYDNGKYCFTCDGGFGDQPYRDWIEVKKVYSISPRIVFVTFNYNIKYDDGIDMKDTSEHGSAVLYKNDDNTYALLEYKHNSQKLTFNRFLLYATDFQ